MVPTSEDSHHISLHPERDWMVVGRGDDPEPGIISAAHWKIAPDNHVDLLLVSQVDSQAFPEL